ncbi:HelD family protein [Paenibacillus marinisediminis]
MNDTFQSAYQEEHQRLEQTLLEISKQYEALRRIPVYTGNNFTEQVLEDAREQRRQRLKRAEREPYFGRIDIRETTRTNTIPLYIGKHGVGMDSKTPIPLSAGSLGKEDEDLYPLVIDWRAPVASLFYSFTGGNVPASYESPEGTIEAEVFLKRNLVVRKEQLQRVVDTYNRDSSEEHVTDEFLVYRLGENKDNRLRDIVSTIQAEQDLIIRAAKNQALFIQGVAGSGKTTVALHRLAYLLYQYHEQLKSERMIIFAPNRMFLDYISDVLPELGVGDIQQRTFSDWALELTGLDERVQLADVMDEIEHWYGSIAKRPEFTSETVGRIKGSLRWMKLLDEHIERWVEHAVPEEDFSPWDNHTLPRATILEWFTHDYKSYEPAKRVERIQARIQRWIEMELKLIRNRTQLQDNKKKSTSRLKAYMKKWPNTDVLQVYKSLLQSEAAEQLLPASAVNETLKHIKKKYIKPEDLASLVYLHISLYGIESSDRFDHVVIDEAQDFSPLQIALLDRMVKTHSFTVLGDLSQGIHAYAGIEDWSEMRELFGPELSSYYALTRSYRSTMEIIHFANTILKRGVQTSMLAEPVFRGGNRVRIVHMNSQETVSWIKSELERHLEQGYQTTAILTRTTDEARSLYEQLQSMGVQVSLIDGRQQKYTGGVSVLPVYLSKGLEFDAVLLTSADAVHYQANPLEARLMYVGCTRALHELTLCAEGKLSPLVPENDDEWTEHVQL